MEYKSLLIIGLVNQDNQILGDTLHFNGLRKYLSSKNKNNTYSISISNKNKNSKEDYFINHPQNKIFRFIYWNFSICFISFYLFCTKKIDLVYFRFSKNQILLPIILFLFNKKYAVEINGITENETKFQKFTKKWILHRSKFVFGAPGYMQHVIKVYNVENKKTHPVSLGYDFKNAILHDIDKVSNELNLPSENLYFIFIGNIQSYQGLSNIIHAIGENKELLPKDIRILIIGDGPEENSIKKLVSQYSLSHICDFIPRQSKGQLEKYLSLKSIGLSPFCENRGLKGSISGLKTFDYLSHKMPILTSVMDEKAFMIEKDEIGWVIDTFENQYIFDLILKAYEEYGTKSENLKAKYNFYRNEFTWERRFSKIFYVLNNSVNNEC
tara:strand:- start:141 stop:1289 length:1149 start_codon:yes stop_codon:yes gene_type:complete